MIIDVDIDTCNRTRTIAMWQLDSINKSYVYLASGDD